MNLNPSSNAAKLQKEFDWLRRTLSESKREQDAIIEGYKLTCIAMNERLLCIEAEEFSRRDFDTPEQRHEAEKDLDEKIRKFVLTNKYIPTT